MAQKTNAPGEPDATRAIARLPGLEIEIVHRRPTDNVEQISINLQATPSFEALGRFVGAANPFVFWLQAVQLAWQPWLDAARMFAPASVAPPLPYFLGAPPVAKDDDA